MWIYLEGIITYAPGNLIQIFGIKFAKNETWLSAIKNSCSIYPELRKKFIMRLGCLWLTGKKLWNFFGVGVERQVRPKNIKLIALFDRSLKLFYKLLPTSNESEKQLNFLENFTKALRSFQYNDFRIFLSLSKRINSPLHPVTP